MANYRAIGGGNVPVRYKEIAKASANQTYAAQLTQLKTTYDTLTDDEKRRSALLRGDGFLFINCGGNTFTRVSVDSSLYLFSCNIANKTAKYSIGSSITDYSSQSNGQTLSLMLLSNY